MIKKNVICDWSGLISDDLIQFFGAYMRVHARVGFEKMTLAEFRGRDSNVHILDCIETIGREKFEKLLAEECFKVKNFAKLAPGARNFLRLLHENGHRVCIFSGTPEKHIREKITEYGIGEYVDFIIGDSRNKIDAIGNLLKKICFKADETVSLGDMASDVAFGKKGNLVTIAVSWIRGYQIRALLEEAGPHHLVRSLNRAAKIILYS